MTATGLDVSTIKVNHQWPRFVSVERSDDALVIRYRRFQVESLIALPLFLLLAQGPLSLAWALALDISSPLGMLFGILVTALLLGLLYVIVGNLVNTSVLSITLDHLKLKTGPLPWASRDLSLTKKEAAKVSCTREVRYSRSGCADCHLQLITGSGKRFSILRAFPKQEDAQAMQALISAQIGKLKN